jgi:hypothetical protein
MRPKATPKRWRVIVTLRRGGMEHHEGVGIRYWTQGGILHIGKQSTYPGGILALYAHNQWIKAEREEIH